MLFPLRHKMVRRRSRPEKKRLKLETLQPNVAFV